MHLNLALVKAAAREAGGERWQRGRLLRTAVTARWNATQVEEAQRREELSVFAGFSDLDEGRGRIRIGNFAAPQFARFASIANPAVVLELVERLERQEAAPVTVFGPHGGGRAVRASEAVAHQVKMLRDERDFLFRELAQARAALAVAGRKLKGMG